jgi:hypothetical protein
VVVRPIESRSAHTASSRGTPIACSTGDGSTAPLAHAAPADTATPRASSAISRWSLRAPGTTRSPCSGSRGARSPWITASGSAAECRPRAARAARAARALGRELARRALGRHAEADDAGQVLGAAAPPALVRAAAEQRLERRAARSDQRARRPWVRRACAPRSRA